MIGHNRGPEMTGVSWRRHCWGAARARLLPVLPVEVVRLRVRRAADLGLDYKTYAGIRATTGHDLVAFLFSENALRVQPDGQIAPAQAAKLIGLAEVGRVALAQVRAAELLWAANPAALTAAFEAPLPHAGFRAQHQVLREAMGRVSGDRVVLVGAAPWEQEWAAAGRLAGYLSAERYFAA